ncbi:replication factor C small subunit [archaeon]|nr:replication factor C small subunit [archaeon]
MEIELPWTEKYRPKKLPEVVGHKEIVARLRAYSDSREMPSLLFAGPPGVGKTVCAIALANGLFGESVRQNMLELNGSDERGIDVIRGKIKDFAAILPFGQSPFKIIFLDEADALTRDAQNALRRTMERYVSTARFILSCNYSSRIIEPIQSRCALLRFKPLGEDEIKKMLQRVADGEKLHLPEDGAKALVYASEGDLRRAITLLQTAAVGGAKKITEEEVSRVASRARPQEVRELIELGLAGRFEDARKKLDTLMLEHGLAGEDVISQLHRELVGHSGIEDARRLVILDRLGEYDFRLSEGASERLQLESFIAFLCLQGKK